ncbi:hypothetical protein RIF29_00674 [Crotalaria pallida]|uniref:Uncharacterized protein n=1 Tax=Crotalaria pallida TaxID=3830 RepID=A0AAN9IWE2_CROPI
MGSHESDSPLNHTHNQTQDNTNTLLHHHHHHHHNHNSHHHRHHCPLHHRHCPHCPLHYHHHYHRNFHSLPPYSTPLLHNPLPLALAAVDYNQTTNAYHDDDAHRSAWEGEVAYVHPPQTPPGGSLVSSSLKKAASCCFIEVEFKEEKSEWGNGERKEKIDFLTFQLFRISQELERIELDDGEQDDEPVFVLTDEWREFFAKSEAKRKLGS